MEANMSRKPAVTFWILALILFLAAPSSAEDAKPAAPTAPAAAESGGPPSGPGPTVIPAPTIVNPGACVISALRIINPLRMPMFNERLRLTDDQSKKIEEIIKKSEDDLRPLILTQKRVAEDFAISLTRTGLQEIEVQTAGEMAMKAEAAILARKIKTLFDIRAVLQPEQIVEFNSLLDQTTTLWRPGSMNLNRPPVQPAAPLKPPARPTTPPDATK
jgi:Spy/CpxP family protein refolding chaperone